MRKAISTFILVAAIGMAKPALAQEMGVSFSFFFPKNGYFSAPISPFSLRGIGFNITNNLALETGGSLYRMSGMNVTNLPFESREPLVGPFFNLMVPVELILQFGNNDFEFRIKGGGFVFYNFGTKLNYGNLDRAFVDYFNWSIANSNLQFDNKIGYGYEFGVEYVQYFSRKFGVSIGANYFIGGSNLNFRGNVSGATNDSNGVIVTAVTYPDAMLDYTGLELSIGIIFSDR
jgi:hypothetical protein